MKTALARARFTALVLLLPTTIGCTALLGAGSSEEEGGLNPSDDNPGDEEIAAEVAETDAELQARDPELFDLAKKYFPGVDAQAAPARYYRLTRRQLDLTLESLLPGASPQSAQDVLPDDPLVRNYELAHDLGFSTANFEPFRSWADATAETMLTTPELVVDCSETDAACLQKAATDFVRGAFRGVVDDEALQSFVQFFLLSVEEVGLGQATVDLVSVTLTSPHFAMREEVHTDGSGRLLGAQALQNLTYALADVPPQELGFDVNAAGGYLESEADLEEMVQVVLASPWAREKLLRFFIAWLEIKDADKFDIAPSSFPEFTEEVALGIVEQTRRFLENALESAAPTLKDVTESTQTFVTTSIADIYGLEGGSPELLIDLDPTQQRGIFTHPAFLASHSGPTDSRLVKRGAYFTKKIMCQELGDPPDGAIPTGPIPGDTQRERIEGVTEPAQCAGCHNYINPFGFMLESYDAIGRFRTEDENGFPIDSSVFADFLDEGPVDETSSVAALTHFTSSAMFRQCFVRQLFTFYTGRRPEKQDDPTLREMFFRFSEGGNEELLHLITILATSQNFHRRAQEN